MVPLPSLFGHFPGTLHARSNETSINALDTYYS